MPPKHSSLPLYFPDWTIVMLWSLVYRNTFLIDFKKSKMQLQDSQSKLPNQTILLPFCTHSIGCQSQLEFSTKYPPSVTVLCQIPVLNIYPGPCGFIHHRDNSVHPVSSLLLSCCTQCYCEALRAQTRWGTLEVLFIIIIIITCQHVVKRNINKVMKFYCCSSKTEEVTNF